MIVSKASHQKREVLSRLEQQGIEHRPGQQRKPISKLPSWQFLVFLPEIFLQDQLQNLDSALVSWNRKPHKSATVHPTIWKKFLHPHCCLGISWKCAVHIHFVFFFIPLKTFLPVGLHTQETTTLWRALTPNDILEKKIEPICVLGVFVAQKYSN